MTDELGGGSYAWALQVGLAVGAAGTIAGAAGALYDAVTGNTESTARSGETLTGGISWDVAQSDSTAAAEQSGSSVGDTWVQGTSRYVVVGEEADSRVGLIFTQVQSSLEDAAVDAVSAAQAAVRSELAVDAVSAAQAASSAVQTAEAAEQSTGSGAASGSAAASSGSAASSASAASAASGASGSAADSTRTAAGAAGSSGTGGSIGSTGSSAGAAGPLGVRTVWIRTGGTEPAESAILAYEQNTASALPAGASPWAGDYAPVSEAPASALWEGASGILTELLSSSGAEAETGVLWGADFSEQGTSIGDGRIRTQPGAVDADFSVSVIGQSGGAAEGFGPLWDENGASASTKAEAEAAAVVAPLSGPAAWTAAEASGLLRDLVPERERTLSDAGALRQMAAGAAPVLSAGSARSRNRSGDSGGAAAQPAGLTMQEILSGIAEDLAARLAVSAAGVHRP